VLSIVLGLVFAVLGLVFVVTWFGDFLTVVKGGLPACVLCGGVLAMIIGISTVKENIREKREKKEEEAKKVTEEKKDSS